MLKGFPVFDLDQIELLRGPQGTLFGRNSPAGVVKFESAKPTQETEGYAQINYGSFGTANFEGAVGGALSEAWSARVATLLQHRDDWVDNTFTGEKNALEGYDDFAARVQFLYDGGGDITGLFNLHARSYEGSARLFRANIIAPGTNQLVGGFERDRISIDGDNHSELDSHGASARLSWDLGSVSLHSITGYESLDTYNRGDIDGGFGAAFLPVSGPGFVPFPAESADGLPEHDQWSQELRIESNEWGALDWQAGVYWFDESIVVDSFNYDTLAPGRPMNGYAVQTQDNTAWAVFASLDYDVTDAFKLRGGVRYTDDQKDFSAQRFVSPIGGGTTPVLVANPEDTNVSGDISAVWSLSDEVNVYARVASGFRAPSIQGRLLFGDSISVADSETVLSYEAGIKADVWDRRARLNFSVFHYTVDDQQLTAVGGSTNFNTLINAAEATGQGFEADIEAWLTDNLFVTFGGSYNDTEIDDPNLYIAPCGGGCTVLDPPGPSAGLVSIDGNSLPQAPKWITNLTARYGIPVSNDAEFYVFTDWSYRTKVNFFLYESAEFTGDPLLEGGLRLGYAWNYGKYDVALFGRNILDEVEAVGGIDFNNLTGFVNEPRIVGVEFKATF